MRPLSRRNVLAIGAATLLAPPSFAGEPLNAEDALADLEAKVGGRLGVCVLDPARNRTLVHRGEERFAMCSTFKLPLAAAILREVDRGKLALDTFVPYTKADMMAHAPVTEANLAKGGMTVGALAEAAQKQSDNPAANLLMKQLGGPAGFTQFFRDLGDTVTRVDRYELEMNRVVPGDERDTTTPEAMAATIEMILLSDQVLTQRSRDLLIQWMIDTQTGLKRLRAGFPKDWRAGDKTGTGYDDISGKVNDIAIAWPPEKTPIIATAYYNTAGPADDVSDEHQAVLAEVGRIAARWTMQ